MPKLRSLLVLTVVVACLAAGVSTASGAVPCWKKLVNDDFDGHVDGTYSVACYRTAIRNLPEDVVVYGSMRGDLQRALAAAIAAITRNGGGPPGPNAVVKPERRTLANKPQNKGFMRSVADKIGPGDATSIPLPLIILGGLGLLLVAVAGLSFGARRLAARRAQPQPATAPATPPRK